MAASNEEKLSFTSPKFDPLAALYSDSVTPPFPSVVQLNNILEYEKYMMTGELPRAHAKKKQASSQPKSQSRAEALQRLIRKEPSSKEGEVAADDGEDEPGSSRSRQRGGRSYRKSNRNVLTRMEAHNQGPLGLLYECVHDGIPIRVCTRTFKGLRGLCCGYLVAYDKYWNLAMVDVDEVYKKPSLGKKLFNEERLTFSKLNNSRSGHPETLQEELHLPHVNEGRAGFDLQGQIEPEKFLPDLRQLRETAVDEACDSVKQRKSERTDKDRLKSKDCQEDGSSFGEPKEIRTLEQELATLKEQLSLLPVNDDEDDGNDDNDGDHANCGHGDDGHGSDDAADSNDLNNDFDGGAGDHDSNDDANHGDNDDSDDNHLHHEDGGDDNDSNGAQEDHNSVSDVKDHESDQNDKKKCTARDDSELRCTETLDITGEPETESENTHPATERAGRDFQKECKTSTSVRKDTEIKSRAEVETTVSEEPELAQNKVCASRPVVKQKQGKRIIDDGDFIRRHVNQLFIRGDNVVMVMVCRENE